MAAFDQSNNGNGAGALIPEDAVVGGGGQHGQGEPIPEGATIGGSNEGPSTGQQQSNESHSDPKHDIGGGSADFASDIGKGALEAGATTLTGMDDWMRQHGPAWLTNKWLGFGKPADLEKEKAWRGEDHEHTTAESIGYGGETLAEFMMGDAALKALPLAKRLFTVAKWMEIAEKSPKLITAMRLGANALKAGEMLTPEEAALVTKYPKLAKLVGIGIDSLKVGAIQGAQTTARTGDVKQGAVEGGEAALITGGMGAVLGGASHLLGKGGKAAKTVAEMGQTAEGAPTKTALEGKLADVVKGAHSNELGTLQNQLDDSTAQIGMYGEGAPGQQAITQAARNYARTTKQGVHDAYQAGYDQLVEMAGDHTLPYEGSATQQWAQQADRAGSEAGGGLDKAFSVGRPGSPRANNIIDNLLKVGKEGDDVAAAPEVWYDETGQPDVYVGEHGQPAAAPEHQPQPEHLDMAHLVEYRQRISRLLRGLSRLSPDYVHDRALYGTLQEAVETDIGNLANRVDGAGAGADAVEGAEGLAPGQARNHFDRMNEAYRQGIQPYSNTDVKNIMKGNLNDVAKSIMSGQTSIDDIDAVRKAVGPANFRVIGDASMRNIVQSFMDKETGELNYKGLFKQFSKIKPEVRQAMFGSQGEALATSLKLATDSKGGMEDIEGRIQKLLGDGDINSILKNPEQARDIANTVGPEGMKVLGQSILESKISEASTTLEGGKITKSRFDPDKVLDWWMSMKDSPEVRDAFFTVDKDTTKSYNELMGRLQQASSVKKLIKYGVLPITLGTAGVVHGPGAALVGVLGGLGTEAGFGRARDILDAMANHPRTWKFLGGVGKLAEKAGIDTPAASRVKRTAAAGVFNSLKGVLGGPE